MISKIKQIYGTLKDLYLARRLLSSLNYSDKRLSGKTIVFFSIRSFPLVLHQELFLAYQLAELGGSVKVILDDGFFKHWDFVQSHDGRRALSLSHASFFERSMKGLLANFILRTYRHNNINIVYLSDFLSEEDLISVQDLTHLEKQQAESSVRRFFENGQMDLNDDKQKAYYELSLKNCAVSRTAATRILQLFKPNLFVTSHGIYSVWGPAFIYMKKHGISSLVYGAHAYKSGEIIISDVIAQTLSLDSDWKSFEKNHQLSESEESKIRNYFESRIGFSAHDTKIYYGAITKFETIKVERAQESKNFALFPNIIWDGDVYERDTIFSGIIDWVSQTIEFFKKSHHNLIIRFHPAEATLWKDSKPLKVLSEKFFLISIVIPIFI